MDDTKLDVFFEYETRAFSGELQEVLNALSAAHLDDQEIADRMASADTEHQKLKAVLELIDKARTDHYSN